MPMQIDIQTQVIDYARQVHQQGWSHGSDISI